AAVLDDEPARARTVAPGVPAERRRAAEPRDDGDRTLDVLALDSFVDVLVAGPAVTVARDLVAIGEERVEDRRIALERHRDAEDRERHRALAKRAQHAPHA